MDQEKLKQNYQLHFGRAEKVRDAAVAELEALLQTNAITLGVPIEKRIKSLASICEKIDRKGIPITDISILLDFIGIRIITLFLSDLELIVNLIHKNFDVISTEDKSEELGLSEFGYQSRHFIVKLPTNWLAIPSLFGLGTYVIEIQVRTLSQHIWAAASHKLQYKKEDSVPPPIRRAIMRASALLEMVDLEFERVLSEKESYSRSGAIKNDQERLNIDNIAQLLLETFPVGNKIEEEPYSQLWQELLELGVDTRQRFRFILSKFDLQIMMYEEQRLKQYIEENDGIPPDERSERGFYFTHVGMARHALRCHFGKYALNKAMGRSLGSHTAVNNPLK